LLSSDNRGLEISRATFGAGMPILDLLVAAKICDTKGEAKRLVEQGGISIDDVKVADFRFVLAVEKFADGSGVVLRKGKKNFYSLKLS
jgi:tyrosyl-tRNA synthetase